MKMKHTTANILRELDSAYKEKIEKKLTEDLSSCSSFDSLFTDEEDGHDVDDQTISTRSTLRINNVFSSTYKRNGINAITLPSITKTQERIRTTASPTSQPLSSMTEITAFEILKEKFLKSLQCGCGEGPDVEYNSPAQMKKVDVPSTPPMKIQIYHDSP